MRVRHMGNTLHPMRVPLLSRRDEVVEMSRMDVAQPENQPHNHENIPMQSITHMDEEIDVPLVDRNNGREDTFEDVPVREKRYVQYRDIFDIFRENHRENLWMCIVLSVSSFLVLMLCFYVLSSLGADGACGSSGTWPSCVPSCNPVAPSNVSMIPCPSQCGSRNENGQCVHDPFARICSKCSISKDMTYPRMEKWIIIIPIVESVIVFFTVLMVGYFSPQWWYASDSYMRNTRIMSQSFSRNWSIITLSRSIDRHVEMMENLFMLCMYLCGLFAIYMTGFMILSIRGDISLASLFIGGLCLGVDIFCFIYTTVSGAILLGSKLRHAVIY